MEKIYRISGIESMWEDELDEILEDYWDELVPEDYDDICWRADKLQIIRMKLEGRQTEMLKTMKAAADAMSDYFYLIDDYGAFTKVKDLDDVLKKAEEYLGYIRNDIALLRTEKAKEAAAEAKEAA